MDIDQRLEVVDSRKRTGDWEGDTIIGARTGGAVIVSMVERKSRFTCLAKAKNKQTSAVIDSINKHMLPIADLVLTVTLDNSREFSQHDRMSTMLWERGLNENTNGLVRQYLPKMLRLVPAHK